MRCVRAVCDCGWAVDALTDTQVSHHHTLVYVHFNFIVWKTCPRHVQIFSQETSEISKNCLKQSQFLTVDLEVSFNHFLWAQSLQLTPSPKSFSWEEAAKLQYRPAFPVDNQPNRQTDAFKWEAAAAAAAESWNVYSTKVSSWPQITGVFTQATTRPTRSSGGTWERHLALMQEAEETTGWHQRGLPQSTAIWRAQFCENTESLSTAASSRTEPRSKCLRDLQSVKQ